MKAPVLVAVVISLAVPTAGQVAIPSSLSLPEAVNRAMAANPTLAAARLTGAINQAMDKGPTGPLRHEFFMVVRDLRSGLPRADALRRMEKRLAMMEITSFVGTVIQAEKMGARLGAALRSQAEQRRTERFQRAEKLAMEAPVKLIGPLMIFIFPITFVVIGFPIVVKYMSSGMM